MSKHRIQRNPHKKKVLQHRAVATAHEAHHEVEKVNKLIDFGEKKYGYGTGGPYGPFISGGFREHWPEWLKDKIRSAHGRRSKLNAEANEMWRRGGKRKPLHEAVYKK